MENENENENETSAVEALVLLLLTPFAIMWSGFVLTQLWGWFVVPLGVVAISMWHAAGLSMTATWLSGSYRHKSPKTSAVIVMMFLLPAALWGFGGIYHILMLG